MHSRRRYFWSWMDYGGHQENRTRKFLVFLFHPGIYSLYYTWALLSVSISSMKWPAPRQPVYPKLPVKKRWLDDLTCDGGGKNQNLILGRFKFSIFTGFFVNKSRMKDKVGLGLITIFEGGGVYLITYLNI